MKWSSLMLAALLLLIFIGCKEGKNQKIPITDSEYKQEEGTYASDTIVPPEAKEERQEQQNVGDHDWEKKIIKTATLNIQVKDYNKYYNALYAAVKRAGGYVAQEDQSQTEYK